MNFFEELENYDKEVFDACSLELGRQRGNIELIASENVVSKAVLLAAGTVLGLSGLGRLSVPRSLEFSFCHEINSFAN